MSDFKVHHREGEGVNVLELKDISTRTLPPIWKAPSRNSWRSEVQHRRQLSRPDLHQQRRARCVHGLH